MIARVLVGMLMLAVPVGAWLGWSIERKFLGALAGCVLLPMAIVGIGVFAFMFAVAIYVGVAFVVTGNVP